MTELSAASLVLMMAGLAIAGWRLQQANGSARMLRGLMILGFLHASAAADAVVFDTDWIRPAARIGSALTFLWLVYIWPKHWGNHPDG